MMKKISDLAYVLLFILFVILSTLLVSQKFFSDNDLVDNDKNIETQSELAPDTTINKFETLSKYGYILQEINGKYCISLPSYQAEPFECFEDEQSALEDWEFRINLEDYRQGWVAQLLYYPPLNEEEYKITNDFLASIEPGSTINLKIDGEDYSCIDKDSGTVQNRFANEVHPINLYEEGEEASSNLGYSVSLDYYCTQLADGSSFLLYGPLFYQDNQWWGFQESENNYWKNYEKDIEILAFMTRFAKRVAIDVPDEIYSFSLLITPPTTILDTRTYPQLPIQELTTSIPKYNRSDWSHWSDDDSDCQNVRHEVLQNETQIQVTYTTSSKCYVDTGKWYGVYTGTYYYSASELDVDHFVPLKNAHDSGGYNWSIEKKKEFANYLEDPDHLIAVQSSANRSKGADGPENWRPANIEYWCEYAYDWIRIKNAWGLTATQSEWNALVEMINYCPVGYEYEDAVPKPLVLEKYNKGWIEKLETYPVLTKDEFDKSIEFFLSYRIEIENFPFSKLEIIVDSNNYVCERKTTGTIISAYANERHPLSLYISETGDNENAGELTIYEYIVSGDYNCSLENSEEGLFLWGPLFFQDNQWWGFIEYEDDYWEQSGKPDVLIRSFAKRVSLGVSINA